MVNLRRRSSLQSEDPNPTYYRESDGMAYKKFHVYSGTNSKSFANCTYMETFEATECVYTNPGKSTVDMFDNCISLKSIKLNKSNSFGHYVFAGCNNVEFIQLGSVGYPFAGNPSSYFRRNTGTIGNKVGTEAGLTMHIYVDENSYTYWTNPFSKGIYSTTKVYYYSSNTGEYLQGVNV